MLKSLKIKSQNGKIGLATLNNYLIISSKSSQFGCISSLFLHPQISQSIYQQKVKTLEKLILTGVIKSWVRLVKTLRF